MELEQVQRELNETKKELRNATLKIQHYREALDQKEVRIADLRVNITDLEELAIELNKELMDLRNSQVPMVTEVEPEEVVEDKKVTKPSK